MLVSKSSQSHKSGPTIRVPFKLMQAVGTTEPRVLVCIDGSGQIEHERIFYAIGRGETWLLPAEAGICGFQPNGEVTLPEIAIPGVQGIGDSAELE